MEGEADIEERIQATRSEERKRQRIEGLLADLRAGKRVTDFRFDQVFPRSMRELSNTHWTPVETARRAATLLSTGPKCRILDVGSGCGKFCIVGALTADAMFVGVEQRAVLVETAKATRDALKCRGVVFVHGNMACLDWRCFDSFYLYNPFWEHQVDSIRMDQSLVYGEEVFDAYVRVVQKKLAGLRVGTRVVTYHGFGGNFPPGYRQILKEPSVSGFIELWEKTVETPKDWAMIGSRPDEEA